MLDRAKKYKKLIILLIGMVVFAVISAKLIIKKQETQNINSFEECAKYFPVMETYPETCRTNDGKFFTNER